MLTFGSLFAGIGGLDLGFEQAGWRCGWQVEINPFCRQVLAKHWPNVRRWDDVRTFPPQSREFRYSWRGAPSGPFVPDITRDTTREQWAVDCIVGGFPCQDISRAGLRAGIDGERSGLWSQFARVLRVLRPRFAVVENVAALLDGGIERVLGDLASDGFDAIWEMLPACAFGAPHTRQRLFVVAYSNSLDGWAGIRDSLTQPDWTLQAIDGSPRARAGWQARVANPSELYRGADGVPFGRDRNRGIGNAVCPPVARWIAERIARAVREATQLNKANP